MANLEHKPSQNLAESALHARLRDKLNMEGIKLWLEPFYDAVQKSVSDSEILALSARYATELELSEENVVECIYSLQRNAIERLAERQVFKNTGLATIRFRFSGFSPEKLSTFKANAALARTQLDLARTTGKELKENIAKEIAVAVNSLKLIAAGKVIKEEIVLEQQNIKNGGQIMVLSVAADHETLQEVEDQFRELEETKNSADFLSNKDGTDGLYSLQVADQTGKALDLPLSEKKALTIALALHEKGRSAMKTQLFSRSLVFLLEADTVYSQCQSTLLTMVDNYGLLNLDIAWCYLSLQSISELPQVENRLQQCEKSLKRSYGEDMERVIALKGSTGWEAALYVRLHLLQGITNYHMGHIEKSKFYINKAETELYRLRVSDESLVALINMGYEQQEARMALRATYGDMASAVDWIIRKREERALVKAQEAEDLIRRKLQKKLGKTVNGELVSVQAFKHLKGMGFGAANIAEALKVTNNDMNAAIQLISDQAFQGEVLSRLVSEFTTQQQQQSSASTSSAPPITSSEVASAVANITEILASSSQGGNDVSQVLNNPGVADAVNKVKEALDKTFSDENLDQISPNVSSEEIQKSKKAYDNLSKDMCSEADYIDLTLGSENTYLQQYKALLESI